MTVDDCYDFAQLLMDAESNARTIWEKGFVSDMRERYNEWGDAMCISPGQLSKLERVARYA
jgi:hypothetical protein